MQYAIYVTMKNGNREYLQSPDNVGVGHPHYTSDDPTGPLFSLDSNISVFSSEIECLDIINKVMSNALPQYTNYNRIGYHGITENGNACRPFHERAYHPSTLAGDKTNSYFSPVTTWATVEVGREGWLSTELMLRECDYILATLVDEDLRAAKLAISRMQLYKYSRITDIDKYPEAVTIHFSAGLGGHTRHKSLTIYSFNLDVGSEDELNNQ